MERIVIRHLTGSKANQAETFLTDQYQEITLGRGTDALVQFDPDRDDLVGRHHAKIQRNNDGQFIITDLDSRNGLFVNKSRVTDMIPIHHGDHVQLGAGGPELVFEIDPPPPRQPRETRVMTMSDQKATRESRSLPSSTSPLGSTPNPSTDTPAGLTGLGQHQVGKFTVERMIGDVRSQGRRTVLNVGAVLLGIVAVALGAFYYQNAVMNAESDKQIASAAVQAAKTEKEVSDIKAVWTPKKIADQYSEATVLIAVSWKLVDTQTGGLVYHKRQSKTEYEKAEYEKAKARQTTKAAAKITQENRALPQQGTPKKGLSNLGKIGDGGNSQGADKSTKAANGGPPGQDAPSAGVAEKDNEPKVKAGQTTQAAAEITQENRAPPQQGMPKKGLSNLGKIGDGDNSQGADKSTKAANGGLPSQDASSAGVAAKDNEPPEDPSVPLFRYTPDGKIEPWLTLSEREKRVKNKLIGGAGQGTGFVVNSNGYILTNRRVAAPHTIRIELLREKDANDGGLVCTPVPPMPNKPLEPDLTTCQPISKQRIMEINWVPENSFYTADGKQKSSVTHTKPMTGRFEQLDVMFEHNNLQVPARLVRHSLEHDVALIKVDIPQPLKAVQPAPADSYEKVRAGDPIVVLGYPAASPSAIVKVDSVDYRGSPQDTLVQGTSVTPGVIGKVIRGSNDVKMANGTHGSYFSEMDSFQLTAGTNQDNSGAPVFDDRGEVIGIFSLDSAINPTVTFAVPIKYARALMEVTPVYK